MNLYKANAFSPEAKGKVNSGTITVSSEGLHFESPTLRGTLPLSGLIVRRGGYNDEQIFFEHPEFPGWSIYSSDPALSEDSTLGANPVFARELRAVERSRRSIPKPVIVGLAFIALVLVGLVLLWTQKDRIAEHIADRIPISWEQQFGDRIFAQFENEGRMLTNSAWEPAVSNITSRLLPVIGKSGYEFKFHIKQDTNVNAFAIPGGHVVILTGLLEHADSAEEVAGVLAHEIAHVTRRHTLRNIIKSAGLLVLVEALLGDTSGLFAMAAEGSRYLLEQKFSRDFEREADDTGWSYLVEAKIDPRGLAQFFEKLKRLMADSGMAAMENSLSLVNTHPTSQERIDRLAEKWEQLPNKSGFDDLGQWSKLRVADLVEQLVSPIGPPPEEVKNYSGGRSDMKKLDAHLKALSQGWMAPQVAKARERLISMGTPIFPELVKHLDDKRYSYSFCYASWVDHPVGYAVQQIMSDVIGEGFRPSGYKWRHNPSGSNGQPHFGKMIREIGPEKYADHAKEIPTRQAQKEYVQWYMEKEKAYGFEDKKQEQKILEPCLKRLSEL